MTDTKAALDALKKKISDVCCAATQGSPEQRYAQDAFAILEGLMLALTTPPAPPVMGDDVREAVEAAKQEIQQAEHVMTRKHIETLIRAATQPPQATDAEKAAAWEWLQDNFGRGKTLYQDHPLQIVKAALQSPAAPKTTDAERALGELNKLTAYSPFAMEEMEEDALGEYVKLSDVENLIVALQSPAVPREVLEKAIGEAIGEASMCWEPVPSGVFQSEKAIKIVERLIALLGGKEGRWGDLMHSQ